MPNATIAAQTRMPTASGISYISYPVAAWGAQLAKLRHITTTAPGPPMLGAIRGGGFEARQLDFTPDLAPSGDSITSILAMMVNRVDGAALGPGDLVLSQSWLLGSSIVGWWATAAAQIASNGPVFYKISIIVSTALGSTPRTRDVYQTVTNALG